MHHDPRRVACPGVLIWESPALHVQVEHTDVAGLSPAKVSSKGHTCSPACRPLWSSWGLRFSPPPDSKGMLGMWGPPAGDWMLCTTDLVLRLQARHGQTASG